MKNPFKLPTPVELGKSDRNALPMHMFGAEDGDYTWEDYDEEMKAAYPFRYFVSKTVPSWFRVHISMNVEHFFYWFRSKTYKKQHWLDLRQPHTGTNDDYQWGYIDDDHRMIFACFNVLVEHVDKLSKSKINFNTTEESLNKLKEQIETTSQECGKASLEDQLHYLLEVKSLYKYWTVDRKVELQRMNKMLHEWADNKRNGEYSKEKFDELTEAEAEFSREEEKALIRLVKIRHHLWL